MRGRCSQCQQPAPGYDRLVERDWLFVPLWGIPTHFRYAPRRVACAEHGVVVEQIPWSAGKRPVTRAMMGFLARWARRLSWRETAQVFETSWEAVYRSVEWFVQWGLAQRQLQQVWSVGIDEIHWGQGKRADQFLTVVYQIDSHCRRLLWVGRRRTQATLRRGLQVLGSEVVKGLRFVCSDMWQLKRTHRLTPWLTIITLGLALAPALLSQTVVAPTSNQSQNVNQSTTISVQGQGIANTCYVPTTAQMAASPTCNQDPLGNPTRGEWVNLAGTITTAYHFEMDADGFHPPISFALQHAPIAYAPHCVLLSDCD